MDKKVAIVTGASRGIGAETAIKLAQAGWAVAINYVSNDAAAEEVAEQARGAGAPVICVQGDTSEKRDVDRLFKAVDDEWGRLDGLVNNAGITGPRGRLDERSREDMERVLAVNVIGYMLCAQQAIARMSTKQGGTGGVIVNVSSGSAHRGGANNSILYAASKGAVNSLTIGLSQELGDDGIRVNTVAPGLTRTDMPDPNTLASAGPSIPLGRVGEASEIAEGIVWLMGQTSSYVSGANLRIAGGRP